MSKTAKITAICNQKGGVGKTVTTVNLGIGLAREGKHAWLIIYTIGSTGICISQLAIILTVVAFAFFKVYGEISKHNGKLNFRNVALPVIFSLVVVAILIISFSQPRFNIH